MMNIRRKSSLPLGNRSPIRSTAVWFLVCLAFSVRPAWGDAELRQGDTVGVKIGGVPAGEITSVSGDYTIDHDGEVNLPYIGKVRIAGLESGPAQTIIEQTYRSRDIYTNPTITISMHAQSRWVNVGGEVKAPQRVSYTSDLTILAAINAAGGFSPYADERKVRLLRGNQVIVVDVKRIRANPSLDLPVLPGDRIEVPQSIW